MGGDLAGSFDGCKSVETVSPFATATRLDPQRGEMDAKGRKVHQAFRSRGMMLERNALERAVKHLETCESVERELMALMDSVGDGTLNSAVVTDEQLKKIIEYAAVDRNLDAGQGTSVLVDIFRMPRLLWDPVRKTFYHGNKPNIAADASSKIDIFRQRLHIIQQRLSRHPLFSKPQFSLAEEHQEYIELKQLQSLVGDTGGRRYVLGMLVKVEDDRLFLEDFSTKFPIEIGHASMADGVYTENSIVVVEGSLRHDGVFEAVAIGMPPVEPKMVTWETFEDVDFFGAGRLSKDDREGLKLREAEDQIFVMLSDIFLEESATMAMLKTLFEGFNASEVPPKAFVFMGNFSRSKRPGDDMYTLKEHMGKLGKLMKGFKNLVENSTFIFMPGPDDHGMNSIIPRPPFPELCFQDLKEAAPKVMLAPNPCRLRYCTQEMVLFRQDLHVRMRRSAQAATNKNQSYFDHIMTTLLHQGHLCPAPLQGQPIHWELDHTLYLYPTPDVLVLGDNAPVNSSNHQGCVCMCPGSFSDRGTFMVYRPSTQTAETSSIPMQS